MKRTIVILITVLTVSVAGVLYGYHGQTSNEGTVSLEEAFTTQFPETMPDLTLDPMVGYPVY